MKNYIIWLLMVVVCAVNFACAIELLITGKFLQSLINCAGFIAMLPQVFKSYERI